MAAIVELADLEVGHRFTPLDKEPIGETQLVRYAGASGDFNPLHTVHSVGDRAGFGGVIAHGLLIMGFVAQAVTSWVPNRYLRSLNVRFKGISKPGEVITVTGEVVDHDRERNWVVCSLEAKGSDGDLKVTGTFNVVLPS